MKNIYSLGFAFLFTWTTLQFSPTSHAANTIDPNNTGATDVVSIIEHSSVSELGFVHGRITLLENPLPDSKNLAFAWLAVGHDTIGELRIDNGSEFSNARGFIGKNSGANGIVTVDGIGSAWTNTEELYVGYEGNGILNITDGGYVFTKGSGALGSAAGSHGAVTVSGPGSTWKLDPPETIFETVASLSVGTGELNILNGGKVLLNISDEPKIIPVIDDYYPGVYIVSFSDQPAVVTVDGEDSKLQSNYGILYVGATAINSGGSGILNITGGGTVESPSAVIGGDYGSNGVVKVDGAGSAWINSANMFIGSYVNDPEVTAELNIQNGGSVTAYGTIFIRNNGDVQINNGTLLSGEGVSNKSSITMSGNSILSGDVMNVGDASTIHVANGTANFFGDIENNGTFSINQGATATVYHSFSGKNGTTGAGRLRIEGDFRPGDETGSLAFGGDLFLGNNAETFIELAGTSIGEFDQLDIAGDFNLHGILSVDLVDDFELDGAMDFLIADIEGERIGKFFNYNEGDLVGLFDGTDLFITYEAGDGNDIALFTSPSLSGQSIAGDFDNDGDVDGSDFLIWQAGFGNGTYDASDLANWKNHYGTTAASGANVQEGTVPEPSSLYLIFTVVVGMCIFGIRLVAKH